MSQIIRRLGTPPTARGSASGQNCPDIFELADGNFAIIGTDATKGLNAQLPSDTPLAEGDRIVTITRETLIHAKPDIPSASGGLQMRPHKADGEQSAADSLPVHTPVNRGEQHIVKIKRRIGVPPQSRKSSPSMSGQSCPDIFELSDGSFAVIGTEATADLDSELPHDASRADYERIVVITRETLIEAKRYIPDA